MSQTEPTQKTQLGGGVGTATVAPSGARGDAPAAAAHGQVMLPGEVRPHPSVFQYVVIAVVLCVITALKVTVSYSKGTLPRGLIILLLIVFAVIKFGLVALWYMHLRTDRPIYMRFFAFGIVAAIILYTAVLATFHFGKVM